VVSRESQASLAPSLVQGGSKSSPETAITRRLCYAAFASFCGPSRADPLPRFCGHACRQRAYEQDKWGKPHLARLRRDLDSAAMRSVIRQEVWAALKQLGLSAEAEPRSPSRKRPSLRVVTRDEPPPR
jgi:hypothetical protein